MHAPLTLSSLGRYRGHADVVRAVDDYAALGARRRVVGRSIEGKPLVALELGPRAAPVASTLVAGVQPLAWVGVECALAVVERLLAEPPRDRRVVVLPLVNVDGYRLVEADLVDGRRPVRLTNARGVDLDRNFTTRFRPGPLARGLAPLAIGAGPSALSEPESLAVHQTLDRIALDGARVTHAVQLAGPRIGVRFARAGGARAERAAHRLAEHLGPSFGVAPSPRWPLGPLGALDGGHLVEHLATHLGAMSLRIDVGGRDMSDRAALSSPFRWFNPLDPAPFVERAAPALARLLRGEG